MPKKNKVNTTSVGTTKTATTIAAQGEALANEGEACIEQGIELIKDGNVKLKEAKELKLTEVAYHLNQVSKLESDNNLIDGQYEVNEKLIAHYSALLKKEEPNE